MLQEILINRVAAKKDIDLDKEIERRNLFRKGKFKKQLEVEVYQELFGKDKK